ncbi:MAG: hypothetical protein ACKVJX_15370 [Verrucomicrobiia bacterium]|jgi:hypothetical protein
MASEPQPEEYINWVFICHSQADERWKNWLTKHLGIFRTPRPFPGKLTADGPIPRRIDPIIARNDGGDAAKSLTAEDKKTLRESRYLVVICSPGAAVSPWVDQAVRKFKSLGREHRTLCLIVGGEPYASSRLDPIGEECLPRAIKYEVDAEGEITETPTAPAAADARPGKDGRRNAFLKLTAGMLRIDFGELKQRDHDRGQIQMTLVLASALALLIFFAGFATYSFKLAKEANDLIGEANSAAEFSKSEFDKRQTDNDRQRIAQANLNAQLFENLTSAGDSNAALTHLARAVHLDPANDARVKQLTDILRKSTALPRFAGDEMEFAAIPYPIATSVAEALAGAYVNEFGVRTPLDDERLKKFNDSTASEHHAKAVKAWAGNAFEKAAGKPTPSER